MRSLVHTAAGAVLFVVFAVSGAFAAGEGKVSIERVVSPGGIEAWLVSEPSVPVLAVEIAFRGGAAQVPEGKAGLAVMMAGLLDEGAGALTDTQFQAALEEKAIRIGFGADQDAIYGSLHTLAPYADDAFDLFAQALASPRFDAAPVERVRSQILVALSQAAAEPSAISSETWFARALEGHPYARPTKGTPASVKAITRADLRAFHKAMIGKDRLLVAAVGPIEAEAFGLLLDRAFAKLPEVGAASVPPPLPFHPAAEPLLIERDIPQSVVTFGAPGIKRDDPDFMPAYVMNYVLGGGGFASRLMNEIREKRGLTYGIHTQLSVLDAGGLFLGSFSTANGAFPEAYGVLQDELARMAAGGVSDDELADAKTYLTGSFALRFDSNAKIADQLLNYQLSGYDIDYINTRNGLIEAVTREDVARAAARLLKPDEFFTVVVGKPASAPAPASDGKP